MEYLLRISDLEGRLSLMKQQATLCLDKAIKACGFMKQISILEDKVSSPSVRCCDVSFLAAFLFSLLFHYYWLIPFCYLRYLPGLCW
jgi:hypothetical protein